MEISSLKEADEALSDVSIAISDCAAVICLVLENPNYNSDQILVGTLHSANKLLRDTEKIADQINQFFKSTK